MELINFILQAFLFSFAALIALFIPGHFFINKLKLNLIPTITLSLILGISLWGIQGFIFGQLGIRSLTYIYLIIFLIAWIFENKHLIRIKFKKPKLNPDKLDYSITLVLIFGISIQLLSVIWNFIPYNGGYFFNTGIPDNLYHAGVAKELISRVPPQEPGIYDSTIYNYHYLSNLISAEFSRIFGLDIIQTDFHFFPILLTILFGLAVYSFGTILNIGKKYILLLLLILYFIGDLIPYFHIVLNGSLEFSYSTFDNPMSLWYSFSRYIGLVLFFGGITALTLFFKTKSKISGIVFALILGSIIGFKVYIGLLALLGLFFVGIYYLFTKKYKHTLPLIFSAILSLLLYLPVNKAAGGLVFTGFWRFEDFMAQPMWGLDNYELARRIHIENNNYLKIIMYQATYAFLYLFLSIGFLLVGFFNNKKSLSQIPKELHIFLTSGLIITSIIGLFFIQTTGGANSSQFLISIYIVGSIYSALALNKLSSKSNKLLIAIILALFLLSTMRVAGGTFQLVEKVYSFNGFQVDKGYIDVINYSNKNISSDSVVLVDPNIRSMCLLVNLLDDKNLYYCDTASPADKGLITDLEDRHYQIKDTFYGGNFEYRINHLIRNGITHVVATSGATIDYLEIEYDNGEYKIMKVD